MRAIARSLAPALALAVMLLAPAAAASVDPGSISQKEAVDGVQHFYESVTDFEARFEQVVKRKHLPRPLDKSGRVYFKKPGMMRWDYTQPDKVYYVSDGDVLWTYQPADRIVYKLPVRDSELYAALRFLFGQGNLREEFDISLQEPKDGLVALELTPKEGQQNYKHLTLYVDPDSFEIRRTELVDPLDNASRITFEDPSYDPLKKEGFEFEPPEGVRVEDLEARVEDAKPRKAPDPREDPEPGKDAKPGKEDDDG
ncbi:MAG: outer membrane lipoprotein chaperone LolA [Myxococcota bacterium]